MIAAILSRPVDANGYLVPSGSVVWALDGLAAFLFNGAIVPVEPGVLVARGSVRVEAEEHVSARAEEYQEAKP